MKTFNAFDEAKLAAANFDDNISSLDDQLLNIYWEKKELEEFLPKIGTYATAKEVVAITLAQLAMMEKHIVSILHKMSKPQGN
ncbi:hypothetical protein FNO01nite_20480 [Flavobacterium noncentrifugens]|uniref:Uncharacterized protein n=1 Tax=Flavobacterium noncentrifugens TaxID=1128970 RepID=A0A1G8YVR4_9FLAO|nr:hypothetical protein [Flavobacterium noncentrifugens]GEP51376.1 hypothetical protein FNO01nite_20480 [Flavobacterium noncentrifugens]SDK06827.1 hypothetical protein SAMN04487935_2493 [Flavobacterium noncentrifugens]